MSRTPLVIGHRGASAHAPENTLAAFRMAIDAGADGLEFDVRLSRDGVPVVIHDATLERTGLRTGAVSEMTSHQLSNIGVGRWFNAKFPNRASDVFEGYTVPTLADVLEFLSGFGGLIYVELKCSDADFKDLAAAVSEVIRDSHLLPQIIVKSFQLAAIPEVQHRLPMVQTAALFEPKVMDFLRRRRQILAVAAEYDAHQISLHYSLVTPKLTKLAAAAGIPVTIWTVDDPGWIAPCRKLGIRALITNDPAKLVVERGWR